MTSVSIPGTGRRAHYRHWLRRPRNVGVKRLLLAIVGTLRGIATPPSSWDDQDRAATADRTWKRHRQTQWKERP